MNDRTIWCSWEKHSEETLTIGDYTLRQVELVLDRLPKSKALVVFRNNDTGKLTPLSTDNLGQRVSGMLIGIRWPVWLSTDVGKNKSKYSLYYLEMPEPLRAAEHIRGLLAVNSISHRSFKPTVKSRTDKKNTQFFEITHVTTNARFITRSIMDYTADKILSRKVKEFAGMKSKLVPRRNKELVRFVVDNCVTVKSVSDFTIELLFSDYYSPREAMDVQATLVAQRRAAGLVVLND